MNYCGHNQIKTNSFTAVRIRYSSSDSWSNCNCAMTIGKLVLLYQESAGNLLFLVVLKCRLYQHFMKEGAF